MKTQQETNSKEKHSVRDRDIYGGTSIPISQAISGFLFLVMTFMGIVMLALIFISGQQVITSTLDEYQSREIDMIQRHIRLFLDNRVKNLHDHASMPLFTQTVMQPEENQANICDLMDSLLH